MKRYMNSGRSRRKNNKRKPGLFGNLAIRIILGVFAITLCILLSNHFTGKVNANETEPTMYKHFGVIEVRYGETLWDYAVDYAYNQSYEEYIDEVCAINHIEGDIIRSGQKIIVPFYSEDVY